MKSPRIFLCVLLLTLTCGLRWSALADDEKPDAGPQPSAEEQKAYDELAKHGVLAEAIAQNVNWRYANFRGVDKPDAAVFALLKPCQLIVDLDLGGAPVTDDDLANLEGLANLKRLNLARCQKITDAGLANLNGLKSLKRLYVFESKVSDAGAKGLEQAITGLKVDQFGELRNRLHGVGARCHVVKNTFLRRAAKEAGLPEMGELKGQTAIIVGDKDVAAAAKVLKVFVAEFKKPVMRVGVIDRAVVSTEQIAAIAELPAREVLLAQLLGVLQSPAAKLVRLLNEPASALARVLKAHSEKGGTPAE